MCSLPRPLEGRPWPITFPRALDQLRSLSSGVCWGRRLQAQRAGEEHHLWPEDPMAVRVPSGDPEHMAVGRRVKTWIP